MSSYGRGRDSYIPPYGPSRLHPYDYPSWGYVILYLVVILGSLLGNGLFLVTLRKNQVLHRTAHYLFGALAVRDIVVTLLVIPFVIDQSVKMMEWRAGEALCKMFTFLNASTIATHAFLILIIIAFLYMWYRKNEAYVTEDGQTVVRQNKMHKWSIPLAWVIGLGLAIPAGAIAYDARNIMTGIQTCVVWDGRGQNNSNFWVQLSLILVGFFLPLILLLFPLIALTMQLCGAREPHLNHPHNRIAGIAACLAVVFVGTQAPAQIYMLLNLFQQSDFGFRTSGLRQATPYMVTAFETEMIMNAIVYVACMIHPILYFAINPDYRAGLKVAWNDLSCNKDPVRAQRQEEQKKQRQQQQRQYPARNRAPPILRQGQEQLLPQRQPQIMAGPQRPGQVPVQYHPYPQQPQPHPNSGVFQQSYPNQPPHQLIPDQQFLDNSFERLSPQLPPVFEYNGLKYMDTARIEPRIGYSPQKTPEKTPELKRYMNAPFTTPLRSPPPMEMMDLSPKGPLATSETQEFKLESMESSPGNTLRSRRLREECEETIEQLDASPRSKQRRKTQESQQTSGYSSSNGTGRSSSRPISPLERPVSRQSGVEIIVTGRTRSRTDLCPDVPRSKFEHSV